MLASFGNKIFEVSTNRIYTLSNLSKQISLSIEEQEVEGGKPKIYVKNADLRTLSFDIKLIASLGVNIEQELKDWEDMLENKTVSEFIFNNRKINNKWLLISVGQDIEESSTRIESATIRVELKEFAGFGSAKEKEDDKKQSSKKASSGRKKKEKKKEIKNETKNQPEKPNKPSKP